MIRSDIASFSDARYFHVRKVGAELVTRGLASCSLGHKLPSAKLARPDGIYAEWNWNGRCLTIENDHYGIFPVFYFAKQDEFCVSSSMFKLIEEGASTEIDWAALAVFLRLGFYVGEDTVFKAIRVLPPNARLEWDAGQLRITGGYHFAPLQRVSRQAAIAGYVALFGNAIQRRIPDHDNFAVLLSGGRDSRHILLELCGRKRPPQFCLTGRHYSPASAEDERIAGLVAGAVGVKHVVVDPPKDEIRSLLDANLQTNMTAPERGWKLSLAAYLKGKVAASYDGIGGDILSGGTTLDARSVELMQSARFAEYSRYAFRDADKALSRIVPRSRYRLMDQEVAMARLETELAKHMDAANPVSSFQFWNRTRRFNATSPYGIFAEVPIVYSPFLDHRLYAFLSSLPAELTIDRKFHDETIRVAYPKYRDLPYADREAADVPGTGHVSFGTCRRLIACMLKFRTRHLVDAAFVLPRLLVGLTPLSSRLAIHWLIPTAVYLMQLEAIVDGRMISLSPAIEATTRAAEHSSRADSNR
jgi:asparagine synthase (glutamine-hydrolysing)